MYSTAYTKPVDYSPALMTSCKTDVKKILNAINTASLKLALKNLKPEIAPDQVFLEFLEDDLNFPNAISRINELVYQSNIDGRKADASHLQKTLGGLLHSLGMLGLWEEVWYTEEDMKIINDYALALTAKDFARSDELRKAIRQFE